MIAGKSDIFLTWRLDMTGMGAAADQQVILFSCLSVRGLTAVLTGLTGAGAGFLSNLTKIRRHLNPSYLSLTLKID